MLNVQSPTGTQILAAGLNSIKFLYRLHASIGFQGIVNLYEDSIEVSGIDIPRECISKDDAYVLLFNSIQSAICAHWVGMDEALDAAFKDIKKTDDDFRTVIYMLRCAFSHGISAPKWNITNPQYRREIILKVPLDLQLSNIQELKFNFTSCHGQNVKNADFGNLAGVLILTNMGIEKIQSSIL